MSYENIKLLLDRYQEGTTTARENKIIEEWFAETNQVNADWNQLNETGREEWKDDLYKKIRQTAQLDKVRTTAVPTLISSKKYRIVAAAAIFFFALLSITLLKSRFTPVELTVFNVPKNQKKQIKLSDGSVVWVNADSKLSYPKSFNGEKREVYLDGEAYFDIRHDAAKPFIVHTANIQTRVLGTAFNINTRNSPDKIVITVTRGKVCVADGTHIIGIITPNSQITFNKISHQHIQQAVNAKETIAWQESDILFDEMTFEQAAQLLQKRFKVVINFNNEKLKKCQFSGIALKDRSLDEILKVICAFNRATYHYDTEKNITIDGRGCN